MSLLVVQVLLTSDARWTVEADGVRTVYASRSAAIAAGVHRAMQDSARLTIFDCELDFRDAEVAI